MNSLVAEIPRFLVIGGGAIVAECHLPALHQLGWSQAATVIEIAPGNREKLRAINKQVTIVEGDFRTILAEPGIGQRFDAALITLPNVMHEEAIALCFAAGLDVLCEKPLATDAERCNALAELADQSGKKLAVAMVRRYTPALQTVREALASGLIGALRSIDITHGSKFAWPANTGYYFRKEHGGLLLNMGVHYIDQLESILGPLTPVSYWDDAQGGVECNFILHLRAENGVAIRLRLSYTHTLDNELIWQGDEGSLRYRVDQFDSVDWQSQTGQLGGRLTCAKPFLSGPWRQTFEACFIEQLCDFVAGIRGTKPIQVSARDAANTAALIDQCYALRQHAPAVVDRTDATLRPTLPPSRVFLTGGSGFVGGKLAERLAEIDGVEAVTSLRNYMSAANIARFPVDFRQIDLTNRAAVEAAMRGSRFAFHLAYGRDGSDAEKFTVESTRVVVESAIACDLESIVVVSTGSVFGTPPGPVTENSPYAPSLGGYGRSKADAEQIALDLSRKSGKTRVIVVCPSAVYGPSGPTFTEMPAALAKVGQFCWVDNGSGNANYVYVDNLIDALLLAAQVPAAHQQRYLVSDGVCTWREFFSPLLTDYEIANYSAVSLRQSRAQPTAKALLNALVLHNTRFMALASEHRLLGGIKSTLTRFLPTLQRQVQADRARENKVGFTDPIPQSPEPAPWLADLFGPIETQYMADKAKSELGWRPIISLSEGQRRAVQWLRHIGLTS